MSYSQRKKRQRVFSITYQYEEENYIVTESCIQYTTGGLPNLNNIMEVLKKEHKTDKIQIIGSIETRAGKSKEWKNK